VQNSESLSELFKQLMRGTANYIRAVVTDFAITSGKKMALFAAALTCLVLALIYLSIGLINWLAMYFFSPAPPYFIVALILLIAAAIMIAIAARKKPKDDKDGEDKEEKEEKTSGEA